MIMIQFDALSKTYGAFAAVQNTLLVVSVASLALQATAARRISSRPGDVAVIEAGVRRLTWQAALGLGLLSFSRGGGRRRRCFGGQ